MAQDSNLRDHQESQGLERASVWLHAGVSLRLDAKGTVLSKGSWFQISFLFHLTQQTADWWMLPRRPFYSCSNKHGGRTSVQVEVINEITNRDARHEAKSKFLDVSGCPEAQARHCSHRQLNTQSAPPESAPKNPLETSSFPGEKWH